MIGDASITKCVLLLCYGNDGRMPLVINLGMMDIQTPRNFIDMLLTEKQFIKPIINARLENMFIQISLHVANQKKAIPIGKSLARVAA